MIDRTIEIEFDGGTPCNIPRLGYGIGYGSYCIDGNHPIRVNHHRRMSANAAEIWTLVRALERVEESVENTRSVHVVISGDSKIALLRCRPRSAKSVAKALRKFGHPTGEFADGCAALLEMCAKFGEVETRWRGRARSVELFGH